MAIDFELLYKECELIFKSKKESAEQLQELCDLLKKKVPYYNWFGFYIAEKNRPELILGPFAGEPTEHVRIPFGAGICGQAANTAKTFLVNDVSKSTNYLACSIKVKSEIVVPVMIGTSGGGTEVAGEIDIDSHDKDAFNSADEVFLNKLALLVAQDVNALRV